MDEARNAVPSRPRTPPVALDPAALGEMVRLFGGDPRVALGFASRYLELLTPRISRVRAGLERRRLDEAEVALLSLRGSSTMLGARRVADCCTRVLVPVLAERWEPARVMLPDLLSEVETARQAIREWTEGGGDQERVAASR